MDRHLVAELLGHLMEAQRLVLVWLETDVYPAFQRSWFCGVSGGAVLCYLHALPAVE